MVDPTGQWMGTVSGPESGDDEGNGYVTVNVESRQGELTGRAIFFQQGSRLPGTVSTIQLKVDGNHVTGQLRDVYAIHPVTYLPVPVREAREFFPDDFNMAFITQVEGTIEDGAMSVCWSNDISLFGEANLQRVVAGKDSLIEGHNVTSWDGFKKYISQLDTNGLIFRGQPKHWPLRTKFHRYGRWDLIHYAGHDVPKLQRHVNAVSTHFFRIDDALEYGALLNLGQHHGFPTPLLDWTASPYIAAYFAFAGSESASQHDNVRIFIFNSDQWGRAQTHRAENINDTRSSVNTFELFAIQNARVLPQQSITTFSNVDDIERHILRLAPEGCLSAVDIPGSEVNVALKDLALMGITPSSLFPGLDGICSELKKWLFEGD